MSSSSSSSGSDYQDDSIPRLPKSLRRGQGGSTSWGHTHHTSPDPPFQTEEEGGPGTFVTPEMLQQALASIRRAPGHRSPRHSPPATPTATAPSAVPPSCDPTAAAGGLPIEEIGRGSQQEDRDRSRRRRRSRSRSGSRGRSRRHRRTSYSRGGRNDPREEITEIKELIEDMKRKAKLSEVKFSRPGTNKNVQFAEQVRAAYSTDMRKVLRKLFTPSGIPAAISDQLAIGDKLVEDRIHLMKIADEYGWGACVDFQKEELARTAEMERKIRRLRKAKISQAKLDKEKKEKEEALKKRKEGGSGGWRGSGAKDMTCYRCNRKGHIARTCFMGSLYDKKRRDYDDRRGGSEKKKE